MENVDINQVLGFSCLEGSVLNLELNAFQSKFKTDRCLLVYDRLTRKLVIKGYKGNEPHFF
jgi:hypothetical protein